MKGLRPLCSGPFWPRTWEGEKDNVQRMLKVVVRSQHAGSEYFVKQIRPAVWSVDPALPLANVSTMGEFLSHSLARVSFTLVMLSIAAGLALLLGLVGIYG